MVTQKHRLKMLIQLVTAAQHCNTAAELPTDSKRIRDIFIASHANIMEKLFVQSFLLLAGILGC